MYIVERNYTGWKRPKMVKKQGITDSVRLSPRLPQLRTEQYYNWTPIRVDKLSLATTGPACGFHLTKSPCNLHRTCCISSIPRCWLVSLATVWNEGGKTVDWFRVFNADGQMYLKITGNLQHFFKSILFHSSR